LTGGLELMQVKVRFTGLVRHHTKDTEKIYEMPEGATVSDLLVSIGKDYGPCLPRQMWDPEEQRFNPLIKATRKGAPFAEENEVLRDGDEIYILSRMAGG
jgi:molybdopterin converting factor small subunit